MAALLEEVKTVLNRLHLSPRKKFGQNFMVNEEALRAIAAAVEVENGQTVIEIGPGLGFLTKLLAEKTSRLIAIEKDRAFAAHLTKNFSAHPVRILEADVLEVNPLTAFPAATGPVCVVGNIPYNITSPILEWLILHRRNVKQAVLTMQWEVAERLMAKPGSKQWGSLSIFVQLYTKVSLVRKVGRQCFWPSPNVDSAVVKLDFLSSPSVQVADEEHFFKLVRRAFQKRRKTILNSLADKAGGLFGKEAIAGALKQAKIDPMRRPETLTLEEWAKLSSLTS